ncbi:hypothetical protein OG783_28625 [Streptomyces jietaisiensis]|uniref:hypothetical protein n=1 Tax=Streptomyces griseoaurantiacus TaxID=68213 RepID=UPI0032527911
MESLTIEGPGFIAQHITDATLTWKPINSTAGAGATAEVSFLTSEGTVAARYSGRVRNIGFGGLGFSIDADIHSARFQMILPFDHGNSAKIRFNYELKGCELSTAIKILRPQQRLLCGGDVRLTIDRAEAGSGTLPPTGTAQEIRHIQDLMLYLSDLDVVQRHCEAYFPASLTSTGQKHIDLRVARLLIEGRCVAYLGAEEVLHPPLPLGSARLALCGQPERHCRVSPRVALAYWLSKSHLNARPRADICSAKSDPCFQRSAPQSTATGQISKPKTQCPRRRPHEDWPEIWQGLEAEQERRLRNLSSTIPRD